MERGMYVAASGMLAELARQDVIANNVANINTPGYKGDKVRQHEFASLLWGNRLTGQPVGVISGGVLAVQSVDLAQGGLNRTDQPLDVGLQGPGFLAVSTPAGTRYTRGGHLQIGAGGVLQDAGGNPILDTRGQRIILGSDPQQVKIRTDGQVLLSGRPVAKLAVYDLTNPRRFGESLWFGQARPDTVTQVHQGTWEASGVDATQAMTDLISSQRSFESEQRMLRTYDDLLQRSANIGQVS